jgi:tetratricopeptide (TPR) repeat protein
LSQAFKEGEKALGLFPVGREPERRVEALYRLGVVERQRSRLASSKEEIRKHNEKAIEYLEDAIALAREEGLWPLELDASLGLAWTHYWAGDDNKLKAKEALTSINHDIRERAGDYMITSGTGPIIDENAPIYVFNQLARYHILDGVLKMDAFGQGDDTMLEFAMEDFSLALEYDELYNSEYQGIRRALNTIHERVKGLNTREVIRAFEAIKRTEDEYNLCKAEKRCRLWREFEKDFGPYEVFKRLTS